MAQKLALEVTLALFTFLYKMYEPNTKFIVHKYNGVKALQKSKIVRTHLLQTATQLIIKMHRISSSAPHSQTRNSVLSFKHVSFPCLSLRS